MHTCLLAWLSAYLTCGPTNSPVRRQGRAAATVNPNYMSHPLCMAPPATALACWQCMAAALIHRLQGKPPAFFGDRLNDKEMGNKIGLEKAEEGELGWRLYFDRANLSPSEFIGAVIL